MNIEYILSTIIGAAVRHGISMLASLLVAYGVTADTTTALIGPVTSVLVAIGVFLIGQIWSFKSKKDAFLTPPSDVR